MLNALPDADVHLGSASAHLASHLDGGLGEVHALPELPCTLASSARCSEERRSGLVPGTTLAGAVGESPLSKIPALRRAERRPCRIQAFRRYLRSNTFTGLLPWRLLLGRLLLGRPLLGRLLPTVLTGLASELPGSGVNVDVELVSTVHGTLGPGQLHVEPVTRALKALGDTGRRDALGHALGLVLLALALILALLHVLGRDHVLGHGLDATLLHALHVLEGTALVLSALLLAPAEVKLDLRALCSALVGVGHGRLLAPFLAPGEAELRLALLDLLTLAGDLITLARHLAALASDAHVLGVCALALTAVEALVCDLEGLALTLALVLVLLTLLEGLILALVEAALLVAGELALCSTDVVGQTGTEEPLAQALGDALFHTRLTLFLAGLLTEVVAVIDLGLALIEELLGLGLAVLDGCLGLLLDGTALVEA